MALTKDQIVDKTDVEVKEVYVPSWGDSVFIRVMGADENDRYQRYYLNKDGKVDINKLQGARARLCALCICDEKGNRLFSDDEAKELGKKSTKAIELIVKECNKLNGLDDEAVEEEAKNSEDSQDDASNSG